MKQLFRSIDRLLRGEFTSAEALQDRRIDVPARTLVIAGVLLGGSYGVFMGLYAGLRGENPNWQQLAASLAKVPLLFLLTLFVTFPSLYVFSALARSRLRAAETLRLLLVAITVTLALLASFGPVTGFFTLSTSSYPFMIVLNVLFFAIAGIVGVGFLRKALQHVFAEPPSPPAPPAPPSPPAAPASDATAEAGDSDPVPEREREVDGLRVLRSRPRQGDASESIFKVWVVMYGVVGAQMAWILRPFIGTPDLPFQLFRERESNFLLALGEALRQLFR